MGRKRLLVTAVLLLTVLTGCSQRADDEFLEDTNDHADYEEIEDLSGNTNNYDRTDEEYIAVFLDNSEDFEYIAQIMQQWEKGYISFETFGPSSTEETEIDDTFYTNEQEMANEILSNEEFYTHLTNLLELQEIYCMAVAKDCVIFYFSKNPTNYRAMLYYYYEENSRVGGPRSVIDEHWILQVLPNN